MPQKENAFRTRFNKMLREKYGSQLYMQKHHGSEYSSGLPDMLYVWNDTVLFAEFKSLVMPTRPGSTAFSFADEPTALQLNTLLSIDKARSKSACIIVHFDGTDKLFVAFARAVEKCRALNMVLTREYIEHPTSEGVADYKELRRAGAPLPVLLMAAQSFDIKMGV